MYHNSCCEIYEQTNGTKWKERPWFPDQNRYNTVAYLPNTPFAVFTCTYVRKANKMHLLTYLLTPWSRVLLEKLTGLQLVKKFPAFYGTRRFITAVTSACHLSLSWSNSIQSIPPHPTSWRSILILPFHLRLGLPGGLFPPGFPTKTLCTPLHSPIRGTCPTHLILLDFITRTILGEEYRTLSSSLCNFLHSPVTSSLLGPDTDNRHTTHKYARSAESYTPIKVASAIPPLHQRFN